MVALTGRNEAYYTDYRRHPQEFISAVKYGYLFQGQRYDWQRQRRGTPALDLAPTALRELPAEPRSGRQLRARTARALADKPGPLSRDDGAAAARAGDADALSRAGVRMHPLPFTTSRITSRIWPGRFVKGATSSSRSSRSIATRESREYLADPDAPETFESCKLDLKERETNREIYALHRDLLTLRREDAAFPAQRNRRCRRRSPRHAKHSCLRFFVDRRRRPPAVRQSRART